MGRSQRFPECIRLFAPKMRAVLSSGVAMLLGATWATATESSSLRGSASQDLIAQVEKGATLDALSDVFFSLAEGSEDMSSGPIDENPESWDLSANAEVGRCAQGWSGAVESIAPGCLGQCERYGICASIGKVVGVWMKTHSKDKAKRKACESKKAFDCLLWGSHRKLCQPLIQRAPKFGIPTNVHQACPRRLDETPAQDVVAQASELTQSTEVSEEHASEDNSGLQHENMTLDAMVAAALSSSAQGCHCTTVELKQCGMKCFSKRGGERIGCITGCLDKLHHQHWCSECYSRRSDCTMNKCLSKCASAPNSKKCTDCVHSNCGGDCR